MTSISDIGLAVTSPADFELLACNDEFSGLRSSDDRHCEDSERSEEDEAIHINKISHCKDGLPRPLGSQ